MKLIRNTGSHFDLDDEFANRLINEILARPLFGHLATGSEQGPRESPVWFLWEAGVLWIIGNYESDSFPKRIEREPRWAVGIIDFEVSTGLVQHVGFRGQARLEAHDTERMKQLLSRYLGELESWDSRFVKILDDTDYIFIRFEPETSVVREQSYQVKMNDHIQQVGPERIYEAVSDFFRSLSKLLTRRRCKLINMPLIRQLSTALVIAAISVTLAFGQSPVRDYRRAHERQILAEFTRLLEIPNVASDSQNIRRNAEFIREMMQRRGLNPRLLETASKETPPAVYGEWKTPGATRAIVLYAHYDGQPTDPKQWTGTLPWQPVWRSAALETGGKIVELPDGAIDPEWRLYARSSSDDKAGVMAILTAFDALRAQGITPSLNIKFIFEGEEEAGSPHLGEIISLHKDLLEADAWIICDGPVHQSGRKQVVFGVRGDQNVDVTVYGAKRPLHSGHYGNWAPNPAMQLAQLLSTMKDDRGRVMITGWYDGIEPLGVAEQLAIAEAPAYDDELRSQLGFARAEGNGKSLLELINLPSLNINGISSGDVGALARNVIPTTATAVLDLRLVKGNDHRVQAQRLIDHIRRRGFYVIDRDPTDDERKQNPLIAKVIIRSGGYNAERTRMDLPISVATIAAVQSTSTQPIVRLPTAGGSLPLSIITDQLRTVTVTVPIANYDNNQHAENENLRLQNLWDGIESMAAVMAMKPKY